MDNEQERRERAYYLWENNGRPDGRHEDHWNEADDGAARSSAGEPLQESAEQASENPAEGSEETIDRELDRQRTPDSRFGQTTAK